MSRYLAALYHLAGTGAVLIGLWAIIRFVWYPDFFYEIDGGWKGLRIIIAVDLVLGPLLTLIVFKSGKAGLKTDLTLIGIVQISCLLAGSYIVYNERPLFFVFYDDRFYSANADTYERFGQLPPNPRDFSEVTPVKVVAEVPDNPIEEANFRKIMYDANLPVWVYSRSYSTIEPTMSDIVSQKDGLEELQLRDKVGGLDNFLAEAGGTAEDYAFFEVHSRYLTPFVAIRKADLTWAGIVKL